MRDGRIFLFFFLSQMCKVKSLARRRHYLLGLFIIYNSRYPTWLVALIHLYVQFTFNMAQMRTRLVSLNSLFAYLLSSMCVFLAQAF